MRDDSSQSIVPISAINPYSSRWTIKARITTKSDLKRWSNAKGEGTLFSIDLLDNQQGEIRATFFKDSCDKFFPVLEEGKVYTFSGGVLKMVQNKQFSNIKNQYELTFNANSDIQPANDDAAIKTQSYAFVKIDQIGNKDVGDSVDLIGIVRVAGECQDILSKAGKALQKRDLTIVDDSFNEIRVTLWGDKAMANYEWHTSPIVAIKGCKIGDYMGRTLSTSHGSSITLNPQSPEGHALNTFRSQFPDGAIPVRASMSSGGGGGGGGGAEFSVEKRKTIQSIKDEALGTSEKPDFVVVKGSVSYVKHDNDPWYTACPTPNCNKKVLEGMGGQWSCEKCNMQFDQCQRRYIATMTLADHSGNNWFSMFNESAEKLLGHTAEELYQFKTEGNEAAFDAVFSEALFKTFVCKIRVKQEQVNDELRVKCNVIAMNALDLVAESKQMIEAINKYN
jgi:replication factor A1